MVHFQGKPVIKAFSARPGVLDRLSFNNWPLWYLPTPA
jgi:hypothetical protein